MNQTAYYTTIPSPIDELLLMSDGQALTGLFMKQTRYGTVVDPTWKRDDGPFRDVIRQLLAYFEGELTDFDLPIAQDGTEFQKTVWAALRKIPFAERISYGELARRIERPSASRAVGLANGRNTIGIVVPCHRVIGSGGSLTGYGGGLARKKWLLEHEEHVLAQNRSLTLR
jgi:methylated-DNA-[protein]-cysteine S-methyltransferase